MSAGESTCLQTAPLLLEIQLRGGWSQGHGWDEGCSGGSIQALA